MAEKITCDFDKAELDKLEAELDQLEEYQQELTKKRALVNSKIIEHKNKVLSSFMESLHLNPEDDNFIIAVCKTDMGYHYDPVLLFHVEQMYDDKLICLIHRCIFIDYSTEFRVHRKTISASTLQSMISDYVICVVKRDVFEDAVQSCLRLNVQLENIKTFREATISNSITVVD